MASPKYPKPKSTGAKTKAPAFTAPAAPEPKHPWESKTVWISVLTAVLPLYPPAAAVVAANPGLVAAAVGAVFAGLRLISDGKVKIPGSK